MDENYNMNDFRLFWNQKNFPFDSDIVIAELQTME